VSFWGSRRWLFRWYDKVNSPILTRRAVIIGLVINLLIFTCGCGTLFQPIAEDTRPVSATALPQPQVTRIAASWAALPLVMELEDAYQRLHPEAVFQINALESNLAHKALLDGQADIAFVFDESAGPVYTGTVISKFGVRPPVIAYDALVVVSSANASVTQVTTDQLKAIYSGRVLTWDQVGGNETPVEFISREEGSATRALFDRVVMQGEAVSSASIILPSDEAVRDYVSRHPGTIGYLSMSYVDARLKIISLDGIMPDETTVKNGIYPLTRPIVGLVSASARSDAKDLLTFALSDKGCQLAEAHYFCPR